MKQPSVEGRTPVKCYVLYIPGSTLSKLPVDSFSITEIVRLHFLISGAEMSDKDAKFRYQQRGAYTSLDDAGLEFRRQEPKLIKMLGNSSIFDLIPGEKTEMSFIYYTCTV